MTVLLNRTGRMYGYAAASGEWTPANLFAASEVGVWYDPSDLSTLWKDVAGTDPVTTDGDEVARMDDKSGNGFNATNTSAGLRPIYNTAGGLHWLSFNDAIIRLQTGSIDFSVTDKVSVFAGLRKEFQFAATMVELTDGATNGRFGLFSDGGTDTLDLFSQGTISQGASATGMTVPTTAVIASMADISGDRVSIKVNGASEIVNTGDQGTGNYSNDILNIGARNANTLPWRGNMYSLIVRGVTSTAGEISSAEAWIAEKTGVTL